MWLKAEYVEDYSDPIHYCLVVCFAGHKDYARAYGKQVKLEIVGER